MDDGSGVDEGINDGAGVDKGVDDGVGVDEGADDGAGVDEGIDRVPNIGGVVVADVNVVLDAEVDDGAGVDEGVDRGADIVPTSGGVEVIRVNVCVDVVLDAGTGTVPNCGTVDDDNAGIDASLVDLCNKRCICLCGLVGTPFNGNGDIFPASCTIYI